MKTMNGNQASQNIPHTFINRNIQSVWTKHALLTVLYINVFVVAFYIKPRMFQSWQYDTTATFSDKKNLLKSSTEHKEAADVEPSLEHGRHSVKKKMQQTVLFWTVNSAHVLKNMTCKWI